MDGDTDWLPLTCPQQRTWPASQECTVGFTGRRALSPWSHASQGMSLFETTSDPQVALLFSLNPHLFNHPFEDPAVVIETGKDEHYFPGAGSSAPGGPSSCWKFWVFLGREWPVIPDAREGGRHHPVSLSPAPPHLAPRARSLPVLSRCTCSSRSRRARRCPSVSIWAERSLSALASRPRLNGASRRQHPDSPYPASPWVTAQVQGACTSKGPS